LYERLVSDAPASTGPGTPSGDVTRAYTYQVPTGTETETEAAFDTMLVLPICVKDATLVIPEAAPRYTTRPADAAEAPLVLTVIVTGMPPTYPVAGENENDDGIVYVDPAASTKKP
jgi:hypothetical protein